MSLSVIVPVKDAGEKLLEVISDLRGLEAEDEVLIVSPVDLKDSAGESVAEIKLPCPYRFLRSEMGRAKQLNAGVRAAKNDHLWFLHCDSRLSQNGLSALKDGIKNAPGAVLYFDLAFKKDGPGMMRVNEIGVWVRSHILQMPFGDQALCLRRDVFERLGGYAETAPYGEDHLLIWSAHRLGVPVRALNAKVTTSARKYEAHGWLKTTAKHVYMTFAQAAPQAAQVVKAKVKAAAWNR